MEKEAQARDKELENIVGNCWLQNTR